MAFNAVFNIISVVPIHTFLEFVLPELRKIFFPSHRLLSYMTISETMDSGERGTNPIVVTSISPQKEYWTSLGIVKYFGPGQPSRIALADPSRYILQKHLASFYRA